MYCRICTSKPCHRHCGAKESLHKCVFTIAVGNAAFCNVAFIAGTVLSAEQARWPFSQLKHLGLYKTHVTGDCLPHLEHLEGLRYLDARSA